MLMRGSGTFRLDFLAGLLIIEADLVALQVRSGRSDCLAICGILVAIRASLPIEDGDILIHVIIVGHRGASVGGCQGG